MNPLYLIALIGAVGVFISCRRPKMAAKKKAPVCAGAFLRRLA